jgi:hypothetical protein
MLVVKLSVWAKGSSVVISVGDDHRSVLASAVAPISASNATDKPALRIPFM